MVLSHLSICLPVCIWATWRGLNLHPSAPVVYAEQSCPVLPVSKGISSWCLVSRGVSHWTVLGKRFVPT